MAGFELFEIIIEKTSCEQRLPDKYAKMIDGRDPHKLKLREADNRRHRLCDVVVVFDAKGHMYLGRDREQFAGAHDPRLWNFLVFSYDNDAMLTVKVFVRTMCRRHCQHGDDASNGSSSDCVYSKSISRDEEEQSGEHKQQSGEHEELSGEEEEQSGEEEQQSGANNSDDMPQKAMVVAEDDLTMVDAEDGLAMVEAEDDLAMMVADDDLAMVVVPEDDLAMVVAPTIPQLGNRTMSIVVEEYMCRDGIRRVSIHHSECIRMMKEKKEE